MRHLHVCFLASTLALTGCAFGVDGARSPATTSSVAADASADVSADAAAADAAAAAEAAEPQGLSGRTVSDVKFGPGIGIDNGHLVRTGSNSWTFSYDGSGQSFDLVETDAGADYVALAQNGGLNLRIRIDLAGNQVLLGNSAASDDTVFPIQSAS